MFQAEAENDPMGDGAEEQGAVGDGENEPRVLKRARKDCIDELPKLISLDAVTHDGAHHTVYVAPEANPRAKLRVELKDENIELLGKKPADLSHDDFIPDLDGLETVTWVASRSALVTQYYSATFGRWCTKSMKVRPGPDMQERVTRTANALEFFRSEHHSEPDQ